MKKKLLAFVMAATMVFSLAACGSSSSNDSSSSSDSSDSDSAQSGDEVQTFKLGSIGPLTGDAAIYGQAVVNGAQLAVDEINASDSKIKFEFKGEDDEADGEKSTNAYNKLRTGACRFWSAPPPPVLPWLWLMSATASAPS